MLEISRLSKSFNKNVVLDDISLSVKKGEVLGIIGPSGTGKSTLLRCVNLLERPERGKIKIGGFEFDYTARERKNIPQLRRRSGMVFQSFNLFKHKSALQNVMEGLVTVQKIDIQKAQGIALERLREVGLLEKAHYYPQHLSGGQQQRVAIARALAGSPDVLLFDEPTSALDPELSGEVLEVIREAARQGWTMLIVSHEMNFIRSVATRVIFLDGGKIVEDGSPRDIFTAPKTARAREFIAKTSRLFSPDYAI